MSILIRNGLVLCLDRTGRIFRDGSVFIEGNKIVDAGKSEEISKKYRAEVVVDAKGKAVIPGLVNTHYHVDSSLFLGLATDKSSVIDWGRAGPYSLRMHLTENDAYVAAMLSCLSNIRVGVTSAVFNCNTLRKDRRSNFDHMVKAVRDSGIKAIVARLFHTKSSRTIQDVKKYVVESEDEVLAEYMSYVKKFGNLDGGKVRIWFGPDGMLSCDPETLLKVHDLAERYGAGIHTHMATDQVTVNAFKKAYGKTMIESCNDLGVLGPNFHAVHSIWVTRKDVSTIAKTKTTVPHNPTSNIALAQGIAPVNDMVSSGVNVSLGTDGPHCLDRTDLFEVMRATAYLQRNRASNGSIFGNSALTVLKMATHAGAKAFNREKEVGSIEVGKKADIAIVDMRTVSNSPVLDPIANLVYLTSGNDVETTIVDGKIFLQNKKIMLLDERQFLKKAQKAANDLIDRAVRAGWKAPLHRYNYS